MDIWSEDGAHLAMPGDQWYGVPYASLIPVGMEGMLVVGKSMSGTHLAMSAYRVQGLLATVGQCTGIAAALVAARDTRVRDMPYADLRRAAESPPQNLQLSVPRERG